MIENPAVSRWRIVAAILVLGVLILIGARLVPIYLRNLELQRFVAETTQRVDSHTKSDDVLRTWVLEKAADLELPVRADNVHIRRSAEGGMKIDVRYVVRVDLPFYTVDLHFYPGTR